MTESQTSTLVFKDQAGDYFLVPRATVEQGRVPDERKAEVERLIAETGGGVSDNDDDVRGHGGPLIGLIILAELGILGFEIGATNFGGGVIEGAVRQVQAANSPKGGGRPPA